MIIIIKMDILDQDALQHINNNTVYIVQTSLNTNTNNINIFYDTLKNHFNTYRQNSRICKLYVRCGTCIKDLEMLLDLLKLENNITTLEIYDISNCLIKSIVLFIKNSSKITNIQLHSKNVIHNRYIKLVAKTLANNTNIIDLTIDCHMFHLENYNIIPYILKHNHHLKCIRLDANCIDDLFINTVIKYKINLNTQKLLKIKIYIFINNSKLLNI